MSTIETNKPTRQKTTIDNDYVAPAGYDHEGCPMVSARAVVALSFPLFRSWREFCDDRLPENFRKLVATILPPFSEVVILADELWDIFCIYPRDNYSRDNFFV